MRRGTFAVTLLLIVLLPVLTNAQSFESFWPEKEKVQSAVSADQLIQNSDSDGRITGLFNAENSRPIRVYGGMEAFRLNENPELNDVLSFIEDHRDIFGVTRNELDILSAQNVAGKFFFNARQVIDGRYVLGTEILLRVGRTGKVILWGADIYEKESNNLSWSSAYSADDAAEIVIREYGFLKTRLIDSEEVWVRLDGELVPAITVTIETGDISQKPNAMVHAETGRILGIYNTVNTDHADGTVEGPYHPYNLWEPTQQGVYPYQEVEVDGNTTHSDADGNFLIEGLETGNGYTMSATLTGLYANIERQNQADAYYEAAIVAPWEGVLLWNTMEFGNIDEMNAYYHTNWIHDWYKGIDPGFSGLDYSVRVIVAMVDPPQMRENAFWGGNMMAFGLGGGYFNNMALNADVVYHEYTHGVTGSIYPPNTLPYIGESGAINEAFSDYIPSSIHNNPYFSRGVYLNNQTAAMRILDNDLRIPEDWEGEVHADGRIMGGAFWDLRVNLGDADLADSLIHYCRYGYPEDFVSVFFEVLALDDDNDDLSDGTPHDAAIYAAFGDHGIGPGDDPDLVLETIEFVEETEDGLFLPGETIELNLTVLNDVILYPPPATGVTVTISGDEDFIWSDPVIAFGDIEAGESVSTTQPFTFSISADAETRYEWLYFDISSNDGQYLFQDSLMVTVGYPEILLVDDGGNSDYMKYFKNHIYNLRSAAFEKHADEEFINGDTLSHYPYVIWFTGDANSPIASYEEDAFVDYVENGGNLILSGQYIGNQATSPDLSGLFGVDSYVSSVGEYGGMGVDGEPLSAGNIFLLAGADGAANQVAPSGYVADESARVLYKYFVNMAVAGTYKEHDSGGSAVLLGFGLEAVVGELNSVSGEVILYPLLQNMGMQLSAPEEGLEELIPGEYAMEVPYPNPFNPSTKISYFLPEASEVNLGVFNIMGQEVFRVLDSNRSAGNHQVNIDMSEFSSGVYFIRLNTRHGILTQRATLVK